MRSAVVAGFAAFYAARTAVNFIGGAISAASDLNETVNKSSVIFGSNASAVDTWAKGAARSIGLSRGAALEAAAGFGNMYAQLGFSADAAAKMSMKTVQMAADLGSFNNLPTADVAEMIAGAFRGEYDSLQRLIPNISAARVEQEAMSMTGKENADSLTAQEKAAAVLAIVQRDGSAAMGDFARTSDGLANSQKILAATWEDGKAKLGALLVGPMTAVTQWISNSAIPWFSGLLDTVGQVWAIFARADFIGGGWLAEDSPIVNGLFVLRDALASIVGWIRDNVVPALSALYDWGSRNADWLLPVASGVLAVVTAFRSWWAISGALFLALNLIMAHPIVATIAAITAAVIYAYQNSETFRNIVQGAFAAVSAAATWMWEKVLQPVFGWIGSHWGEVSAGVSSSWQNVLKPAWDAVAVAALWLWDNVLRPVFTYIGDHWRTVLTAILWAWDNLLHPAWNQVAAAAVYMWDTVLRPIFDLISAAWHVVASVIADVWEHVIQPVWAALWAYLQLLWTIVIGPIFDLIKVGWTVLSFVLEAVWKSTILPMLQIFWGTVQFLWNNVLSPIFGLIGATFEGMAWIIRNGYDRIIHPMWSIFEGAIRGIQKTFEVVKAGVETVWNALMDVVATPINFIIEVVFNKGLFTAWNWIVDTLGLSGSWHAPHWDQLSHGVHFADGGTVPGHSPSKTADNIPAMLTANEFVQPVDSHRYYGTDAMEAVRRREATIAYAKGGWVGPQGTTGAQAPRGAYVVDPDIAKWTGNFLQALNAGQAEAVQAAGGKYANPSGLRRYAAGGAIENALNHARSMQGKPYIWGGVGPSGADCSGFQSQITNVLRGRSPYSRVGTTASFPWAGFQNGLGTYTIGNTKNAFNSGVGHMASTLDGHRLESGSGHGPMLDGSALGATASLFGMHGFLPETGGTFVDAGPGGGQADPWYVTLWHNITGAYDWFKDSIKGVGEMAGRFGNNQFVQMMSQIPGKALGGMWDKIKGTIGDLFNSFVTVGQDRAPGDTAGIKSDVSAILQNRGWQMGTPYWAGTDYIIGHESGWNPKAQNPTSTASGLAQMIDSTWIANRPVGSAAAHMKDARVVEQAQAFGKYIAGRYGDPLKAMAYWQAHHYYGQGGPVVVPEFHNGGTTAHWNRDHVALMGPDERVFTPRQDDYFRRFVDAVESGGGGGGKRMLAEQIHVHGGDTDDVINRLWHKVRVADRGGVYTFTA
jgi:hypothetical protein